MDSFQVECQRCDRLSLVEGVKMYAGLLLQPEGKELITELRRCGFGSGLMNNLNVGDDSALVALETLTFPAITICFLCLPLRVLFFCLFFLHISPARRFTINQSIWNMFRHFLSLTGDTSWCAAMGLSIAAFEMQDVFLRLERDLFIFPRTAARGMSVCQNTPITLATRRLRIKPALTSCRSLARFHQEGNLAVGLSNRNVSPRQYHLHGGFLLLPQRTNRFLCEVLATCCRGHVNSTRPPGHPQRPHEWPAGLSKKLTPLVEPQKCSFIQPCWTLLRTLEVMIFTLIINWLNLFFQKDVAKLVALHTTQCRRSSSQVRSGWWPLSCSLKLGLVN